MRTFTILSLLTLFISAGTAMANQIDEKQASKKSPLRIATFNVSMEALNYLPFVKGQQPDVKGNELTQALSSNHQQIKNIAEIIQQTNPDIILLNEFDRQDDSHQALKLFLQQYLAKGQNGHHGIAFPYFYQGPVNTGVLTSHNLNDDNKAARLPSDAHGFGYYPGHFAMALLSKYPIDYDKIRTFQLFKWQDMPNALAPIDPSTQKPWYSEAAWRELRLSSKSHWDIPVTINNRQIHILASHPTPPVFDGEEDRNGKRNYDEIRFWFDYLTPSSASYIYDDAGVYGGLEQSKAFVILGDLNASAVDGDAITAGITRLLQHPRIQDAMPSSEGGKAHTKDNPNAENHTAFWRMRADYVLPSAAHFTVLNSGVFWPETDDENFRLIKDRSASSDHRLVWVDVELN